MEDRSFFNNLKSEESDYSGLSSYPDLLLSNLSGYSESMAQKENLSNETSFTGDLLDSSFQRFSEISATGGCNLSHILKYCQTPDQ